MKRAATALSACVALAMPTPARAQGSTTALRLAYEASPGCPSAPSFRGQIVARTARVRFAEGEATDHVLVVSLVQEPGGFVGRLRVDERLGSSLNRELHGASCDEVASALALVAALAFDPQAKTDLAPAPRPPAAPPARPSPAPPPRQPPPAAAPAAPAARRFALGAQGRLASGPLPGLWPQAGLFFEFGSTKQGWPSPSARLGTLATWRLGYEAGGGRAWFALTGGFLEGCPARWPIGPTLEARPCLGLGVAWLQAEGQFGFQDKRASLLWMALDASGRLRWSPGGGAFFLEGQAGLSVPLTPYRFIFEPSDAEQPDVVIHKVAPLGGQLVLSFGLSFS
ncbi:MAG TPA: hypothetical protein VFS43_13045 [Polyangiaceae bacterium]|nr:hypothetical protein [Polyangiaceae bacterium]